MNAFYDRKFDILLATNRRYAAVFGGRSRHSDNDTAVSNARQSHPDIDKLIQLWEVRESKADQIEGEGEICW